MFKVGLTGGIGAGKSVAAHYLQTLGVTVIDADAIAHSLTTPEHPDIWQALQTHLGPDFFENNPQTLKRARLRDSIFANPEQKAWLESLLHPRINETMQNLLKSSRSPYVVLSIPLLVEKGLQNTVDAVWVIDCDPKNQVARVLARDPKCSEETVQKILKQQASAEQRKAIADQVFDNNGLIEELQKQLKIAHEQLLVHIQNLRSE